VLATDAGGTAELLGALAETMLARTRDPVALARMLKTLLATPPDPARLRAAVAHLTWERSAEALERCLEAACAESAGAVR
jgi:glycosyltransferase involved in cell wall biosynthesis